MKKTDYNKLLSHLRYGKFPKNITSKSNYRATSRKYKINEVGFLERNGKPVLLKSELPDVW